MKIISRFTRKVILEVEGDTLSGADLTWADLTGADLSGANLTGANLTGASLTGADLTEANLTEANLTRASLRNTLGNEKEVKSLTIFQEYHVNYTADTLWIGCCKAPLSEVFDYSDEKIESFDDTDGLTFWKQNKEYIQKTIQQYPAT